jgi:hypothetical protein
VPRDFIPFPKKIFHSLLFHYISFSSRKPETTMLSGSSEIIFLNIFKNLTEANSTGSEKNLSAAFSIN